MPLMVFHMNCFLCLIAILIISKSCQIFGFHQKLHPTARIFKTQRYSSRSFITNYDSHQLTNAKEKTKSLIFFLNGSDNDILNDFSQLIEFVDTSLHKPILGLKKLSKSNILNLANIDSQKGYVFMEHIAVQQCKLDPNDVHVGIMYQLRSTNDVTPESGVTLGQGILMIEFMTDEIVSIFDVKQSKLNCQSVSEYIKKFLKSSDIPAQGLVKVCNIKQNLIIDIHGNTTVVDFFNARNNRDFDTMNKLMNKHDSLKEILSNQGMPLGIRMEIEDMVVSNIQNGDDNKYVFVKWHLSFNGVQIKFSRGCSYFVLKNNIILSGLDIMESVKVDQILNPLMPGTFLNGLRDSGLARVIADSLVLVGLPSIAMEHKSSLMLFSKLTSTKTRIAYGNHQSQIIDIFEPSNPKGLIVFVHGGAWGSGMPWMYRLIAESFLNLDLAVAILGYRTFPDGSVQDQVNDLEAASLAISIEYPHLTRRPEGVTEHDWKGISLIGHSSGGHISMLMIIERLLIQLSGDETLMSLNFDKVFCLSGVFSISDHFQYESSRGVEELSPMKPACGYTVGNFHYFSPSLRLCTVPRDSIRSIPTIPNIYIFHGEDDDTVPISSSRKATKLMKAWGLTSIQSIYLANVDHVNILFDFMFGGKSKDALIKFL